MRSIGTASKWMKWLFERIDVSFLQGVSGFPDVFSLRLRNMDTSETRDNGASTTNSGGKAMKTRRLSARKPLLCAGALAMSVILAGRMEPLEGAPLQSGNPQCRYEGTWFGRNSLGTSFLMNAVPLDPNGNLMSTVLTITETDATLGRFFPTAISLGPAIGDAIRTAVDAYSFTLAGASHDAQGKLLYFLTSTGSMTAVGCNGYEIEGEWFVYLPGQDKDHDGYVDEGEQPILRVSFTCAIHRLIKRGNANFR